MPMQTNANKQATVTPRSIPDSGGPRRHIGLRARRAAAVLATLALLVTSIGVFAATVPPGGHLVALGPLSSENGFPVWYKDANNVRLELCADADPLCAAPPIPDPTLPVTFPDNFPDESFYSLAQAVLTTSGAGKAALTLGLEATFNGGVALAGDGITFGRVRVVLDNLVAGATYRVSHPYGNETFTNVAGGARGVAFVEDVGIGAPGDFTGALNSRVGPFLKWDTGAPAGYLGDPNVNHAITGSVYVDARGLPQNYFRVEGPAGSFTGSSDLCVDPTLGDSPTATDDCVQMNLFLLQGRLATNAGVNASRATYARNATGTTIDVFASSETDQAIQVARDVTSGIPSTLLRSDGTRYYARLGTTLPPPASLVVKNAGDNPVSQKTIAVIDLVTITQADYDADAQTLTVAANSSDLVTNPALTVAGFGPLVAGAATFTGVIVPPDVLTVSSVAGGSDTDRVAVPTGAAFPTVPLTAVAGADQNAQQGQAITLNGSASLGDIATYQWAQVPVAGEPVVTLSGADTAIATFTAPAQASDLHFALTVSSATNPPAPDTASMVVHVAAVAAPVANAGPDQTAASGTTVTLNGSASTGATTFSWVKTAPATPTVALTGASTAQPTFTFPAGFTGTLTFQLTVTGPGGTASDTVNVAAIADTIRLTATPQYRISANQWRIDGTATIPGPGNSVTITLNETTAGVTTSTVVTSVPVSNLGVWTVRFNPTQAAQRPTAANSTYTITLTSTRGGLLANQAIQVRQ